MKKLLKFSKTKLLLIILAIAAILRLWELGSIPPHLTPDEASLGYNAFSILKTGRDEYGKLLPIIFKSFGDYKPGLYIYLTIPSVALLGLTEFAVRLPSAIAGVVAVWLLYRIVQLLFVERRLLPIAAGFILAISPWHIHFSRGAWEVNLSLTLTLAGIYFFFKSLKKEKYLLWSAVFFASTLLAYQGAKLSTGLVILLLTLVYWKRCVKFSKKILTKSVIVGLIIASPIILSLFQGKAGRLEVFSVFSYPRPDEYLQNFLNESNVTKGSVVYNLFYPESLNFLKGIMGRWFNHYSGRFLFFEGDWQNPRHSAPYHGVLLLSDLVLIIIGLAALIKQEKKKEMLFVWLWLLLAPLPAVLSRDQVHAVRSYNMVIPMSILLALGITHIITYLKEQKTILCVTGYLLITAAHFGSLVYFLDAYFVQLPHLDSKYWEYGYKQIVETVTPIQSNYKKVKVRQSFAQPYIYFLFFQKYDPAKYQEQAKLVESEYKGDVGYINKLDNIEFAPIDWSVNRGESGTLFVADPVRIPPEDSNDESLFKVIKEIKYLNNRDTAFRIVEVK